MNTLITILMYLVPLAILYAVVYWSIYGHRWNYRNPYNRTCKVCGRNEVSHCRDMQSWSKSWWEVFDEGDPTAHDV